jgi:adenylate cyclase
LVDDSSPDPISGAAANGDSATNAKSKSIAVLRFRNIGGNPGHEYLAQDLAEALHEGLSEVADLSVIERDRSFQHSIANETVQGIGKQLGVDHLLEGSVQQLDGRLRVSAALYRRVDGVRLYVYRAEEPVAKLRELQDRLVANVLTAMEVHLDERRADDMRRWGTQNVEAYLAAREGNAFHMRLDQKSLQYAVERFRAAIALDPGFLLAYRLLAFTLGDIDTFTSVKREAGARRLAQIRGPKHLPGNS